MKHIVSIIVVVLCFACSKNETHPIIIATFDNSFEGWTKEGNAFGDGSVQESMGYYGNAHISSLNPGQEPATGTLTSPLFIIERDFIHFLVAANETDFMNDREDMAIELLIDGDVVRTHIPDEYHAFFHHGWNVTEFKGRSAQIRLVDQDDRPYVGMDVDHFVQNDIPKEGVVSERSIKIDAGYLNVPVDENAPRHYFEVLHEGKRVRGFDVALATGKEVDYWVKTDVSEWTNQDIIIRTYQYFQENSEILNQLTPADGLVNAKDLYKEKLRPQFHFTAQRGWLNDPNGLVYYDEEYHLFYQANPFGNDWSRNDYNKTWGHAVSNDLVNWKELPAAIHPDELGSIYSGSAVVDHHNTAGFQKGEEKPIVAVYTSAGTRNRWSLGKPFTQSIAYSTDRGRTFTKYMDNPILENLGYINRDPKAFWYEPDQNWVIILYLDHGAFVFFTSKDLKNWEKQSILHIEEIGVTDIAAFEDCPELFELPVNNDPNNTKWVLYAGSGDYVLGDFDGKRFLPETELIKYNYGDCFYASQTFNNITESDGRRIQMAWGTVDFPGMPFNQMMNFPVSLLLKTTPDGIRMYASPVEEIKSLYGKEYNWFDLTLTPGENLLEEVKSRFIDIRIELTPSDAEELKFIINGRQITYHVEDKLLISEEQKAPLIPMNDKINLRILVDVMSVEVFGNDGRIYMPLQTDSEGIGIANSLKVEGGSMGIDNIKIYEVAEMDR